MLGQTISHYRIVSRLGAGGMGIVYAAEDQRLGRSVALKFVPDDVTRDQTIYERLRIEARTASVLNHANICTIYDIDEYEGRPFIVMELLKGQSLRERIAAGPLKIPEVVDIGIEVADALDWAHTNSIIHRDIKPANLFIVDRGHVKIVDFGLAKLLPRQAAFEANGGSTTALTVAGSVLGTVAYMSPEQINGEELDGRTDVFSLGVVLYESVTAHQPFTGKTPAAVLAAILNQTPVPPVTLKPELPLRLQEVINNCLEKDRELRYQNAGSLRADLRRIKRDLESGHSSVMAMSGALDAAGSPTVTSNTVRPADVRADSAPMAMQKPVAADVRPVTFSVAVAVLGVIGLVLAGTVTYLFWQPAPRAPFADVAGPPETLIQSRLASATASLRAKNYRAALLQSEEVLRLDPNRAEAVRVRDEANASIARFDQAVAKATALLAAGDAGGASAAIDAARAIDPAAPSVSELSARLLNQVKSRASVARPESPAQSAPARVTPAPPQASNDAAGRERPRASVAADPPSSTPPPAAQTPLPPVELPAPSAAPSTPAATAPAAPAPPPASVGPPASVVPPAPAPPEPPPSAREPVAPATAPSPRRETSATPPGNDNDDAAIRRVVAAYVRAIETKDLALFRSIKPNMSAEEQRRIEEGFRAVSSQRVAITILAINRRDQEAAVRLKRNDTIDAGGRQQTIDTQQTMTLIRSGGAWIIREIGR